MYNKDNKRSKNFEEALLEYTSKFLTESVHKMYFLLKL